MDRKTLIKNLKQAFSDSTLQSRYSEVWLSYLNFGGIYHDNKSFVLNVRTREKVEAIRKEIRFVFKFLRENFKEEEKYIHSLSVHPPKTGWEVSKSKYVLYDDEDEEA